MNDYIVTFYTHFGAVKLHRDLIKLNMEAKTMPVPRKLSSSCGTCVRFSSDEDLSALQNYLSSDEIEKIFGISSAGDYYLIAEYDN